MADHTPRADDTEQPRARDADASELVRWRRVPDSAVEPPLCATLPYFEISLEHPGLDPTGQSAQFVPDAIPYQLGDERRVFFWRSAFAGDDGTAPGEWRLACATTRGLSGIDRVPSPGPALTGESDGRTVIDVDGTIAGGASVARVASYEPPSIAIEDASPTAVTLTVDGETIEVPAGSRRALELDSRRVRIDDAVDPEDVPASADSGPAVSTPTVTVRYPGRRTIYHPAPDASYQCFPSFGLDLDRVSRSIAVPTTAGELDDGALAATLGVDLTARPYPERVLWQAFAYAAFDPHADCRPELLQWDEGWIGVLRR